MTPRQAFHNWIRTEWAPVFGEPSFGEREKLYWVFLGGRSSAFTEVADEACCRSRAAFSEVSK